MKQEDKDTKQKSGGVNPLVMGAVGVAAGAAAVILSDEKNRQKAMDSLNQVGDQVGDGAAKVKAEAADKVEMARKHIDEVSDQLQQEKDMIKKEMEAAKKNVQK